MGQKSNAYRLMSHRYLESSFSAKSVDYSNSVVESQKIREYFDRQSRKLGWKIVQVQIIKFADKIQIEISSLAPGIVTGKKGSNLERINKDLKKIVTPAHHFEVFVCGVSCPETNAQAIAIKFAQDLRARKSPSFSMKRYLFDAMTYGAKGILIQLKGRIGGREIARTMRESLGSVPRQNIRMSQFIDYCQYDVETASGVCGLKVLVNNYKAPGEQVIEKRPTMKYTKPRQNYRQNSL